jgi:hyperosmotically inducible protein
MQAMKHLLLASALVVGLGAASAFAEQAPADDAALASQVKAALSSTASLAGSKFAVQSKGGVVQLSGSVTTDDQYAEAYRVAMGLAGVQSVVERVIVLSPSAA